MTLPTHGSPNVRQLTLVQAVAGLAHGTFTAFELARSCLARIRQYESSVQTWAWLDEDRMVDCARSADERRSLGNAPLLCGIPVVGVKDIIHTRGLPTRMCSPVFRDFVPQDNAACVDRHGTCGRLCAGQGREYRICHAASRGNS